MSKKRATDLLRRNAGIPFAAFAIITSGDTDLLCVRRTQLLETMEVQEFVASCECVAGIADAYEKELGKDEF